MIPQSVLGNLQSWLIQIVLLGSAGAVLPLIFRIRHPRSQLMYYHFLLLACLVLPLIQPWQHPVIQIPAIRPLRVSVGATPLPAATTAILAITWREEMAWILIAGCITRLCWTGLGLLIIRRHKSSAIPLEPDIDSIIDARLRANADATFCISSDGSGPVTFGLFRPVVLLPRSFLSLPADAQCSIACHELLHVRRRDWLTSLLEEVITAVFWFHPAFWWLLDQAKLAREQIVDAEVVRVAARDSYIHALLTIASARPALRIAPAALFLRRRHLLQRMHLLVSEVPMSKLRLTFSYTLMAALVATVAWLGFAAFPLTGRAEVHELPAPAMPAPTPQNSPGYVVNIQPNSYPQDAIEKKIEGTVAVELTFNAAGNIVDARVLSGPEELRKAALESALRGSYSIDVARTLQVLVEFKLANLRAAARGRTPFGATNGAVPPPPPPPLPPPPPPPPVAQGTVNGVIGGFSPNRVIDRIEVNGTVTGSETSRLHERLQPLEGTVLQVDQFKDQLKNAAQAVGIDLPINFGVFAIGQDRARIVVTIGAAAPRVIATPFGNVAVGTTATPFGAEARGNPHAEMGSDSLAAEQVSTSLPEYPPLAKQARIQGVVVLEAKIGTTGSVEDVTVVTGHPVLKDAAVEAVKQWVYRPQASPTKTIITINFRF